MTEMLPFNIKPQPMKLRVEDYLLLDRSGAFEDYAKTELIEGEIWFMNAQHRPHARMKGLLYRHLAEALEILGIGLEPLVEASIAIPPHNAPEPDIVVTSEPMGEGLIPLSSVRLIVEVSDATLDTDLGRKAALYASAGVPEYWVADVKGRVIQQMWAPKREAYAEQRQVAFGNAASSATIMDLAVSTDGL